MSDTINHPTHYTQGGIECIDAIEAATSGLLGIEAVCTGNVIKYLWRWKSKNGVEDLRKARWYLGRLIKNAETAPVEDDNPPLMVEQLKQMNRLSVWVEDESFPAFKGWCEVDVCGGYAYRGREYFLFDHPTAAFYRNKPKK